MSPPRTLFMLGKGGVGKTTCALALARALSSTARVTVVSLDPAHNLGDLAGVPLGRAPVTLMPGLEACEPDLEALSRERAEGAVDLIRAGYRHLDALSLGGLADLVQHAPGLEEQSALDALGAFVRDLPPEDVLVVDMPPTGLSVRMLALPALSLRWIECLAGLRRRIIERRASIAHVRGRQEQDRDHVMDRLGAERDGLALLCDLFENGAAHVLVVNPDPLSIAEAGRLREVLRRLGTDAARLVINRGSGTHEPAGGLADLPSTVLPDLGGSAREPGSLDKLGRLLAEELG
ncbi:MAG: ArsA family ATPase [Deltaproteobacteria bacterium]|nr:ArsA family ATPase [Deltaproteobacteria bacterium]